VEPFNKSLLDSPHWTLRNRTISLLLSPNKSLLDLGCGSKDILKYYKPSRYLGIDIVPQADLILDLNKNINIEKNWDYVVCSGILEYLEDPFDFIKKINTLGNNFIFTWYHGVGTGRPNNSIMKNFILLNYNLIKEIDWGSQKIFQCFPKSKSVLLGS